MKTFYLSLIFSFCGILELSAQTRNEIQIGYVIPSGDFADDGYNDPIFGEIGFAEKGLYLGYKSLSPLSVNNLYWTFSAGFMINGHTRTRQDYLDYFFRQGVYYYDNLENKYPKYINIPIIIGLQYETKLSSMAKLFGEAGVGLDILKMTNMSICYDFKFPYGHFDDEIYRLEGKYKYKPSLGLGYKIGGGLLINDKYSIGLTYLGLGSHKCKSKSKSEEYGDFISYNFFYDPISISSLNIDFGFIF